VTLALLAALAAGVFLRGPRVPQPGSQEYLRATTAFYRGLAALEVGLLDDARQRFVEVTAAAPNEAAGWANLALSDLRLGELERAAPSVDRALEAAPGRADLLLLSARLASAQGRVDDAVALLRQATAADEGDLRAKYALVEEIERAGSGGSDEEVTALLDDVARRAPQNLAILVERGRLAARRQDAARSTEVLARLEELAPGWPETAMQQLAGFRNAVRARQWTDATRAAALLRNVLARVPAFSEGLGAVRTPAELVTPPFMTFVSLRSPTAEPAAPDEGLSFALQATEPLIDEGQHVRALFDADALAPTLIVTGSDGVTVLGVSGRGATWGTGSARDGLAVLDWDHDFRQDLVAAGPGGVRVFLQNPAGSFTERTPAGPGGTIAEVVGLWPADVEMDGDLDVVVGVRGAATRVLRNNGDGSWRGVDTFGAVADARAFSWADLDGDADPDASIVDGAGRVHVLLNRQGGAFVAEAVLPLPPIAAQVVADLDANGRLDLVVVGRDGVLRRVDRGGSGWTDSPVATWTEAGRAEEPRVLVADFDNNGALDVLVSTDAAWRVWLGGGPIFRPLEPVTGRADGAVDLDGDGALDVFGASGRALMRWSAKGTRSYRSKLIRVRAQQNAGDQRINSFGLGGDIQVRAGLLWQKQPIDGPVLHFGLGTAPSIDVARIVWPNGVPQGEFDVALDAPLVAEQRLKGSCPWVFAHNGTSVEFVTDFLWRSPLGLRLNAQDTAGITQTEDWVRIRGDQLQPVHGAYDVRITAELWETHFFDHVSLIVADHPADTEAFVDERFQAGRPPRLAVQLVRGVTPVAQAVDESGKDVTATVEARDGVHLATFEKGLYQGIAREHFVEFEAAAGSAPRRRVIVAHGWVYPTDSSINLAVGQGGAAKPSGLILEAHTGGRWRVAESDLGFPAGKNKTMLIDVSRWPTATRFRLRTNLEIYWDAIAVGERVDEPPTVQRLQVDSADLRFRGYSRTVSSRGESPETPIYAPLANVAQRWRDLEGYYTRFGEVRELLHHVDDRYVIMNAGDELRLRFPAPRGPTDGWRRDFVLVGDGWEKDGDYNTEYSQTVLPLPEHARPNYGTARQWGEPLERDPVFQRYPSDWATYHTRYVTPGAFTRGLAR
jgi:tetratricopeptide (TPR) repeat protein